MKREYIKKEIQKAEDLDWYQKFEVIKNSGIFTPGWAVVKPENWLKKVDLLPGFFKKKRVLDIGADAGANSFFMEDCCAMVTAMDTRDPNENGFNVIKSIRKSNVNYIRESVYNIDSKDFGPFDIILLFNIISMLKHPLLAFEKINAISKKNTLLIGNVSCCNTWFPPTNADDAPNCGVNFDKITKKKIRNKKILTAAELNDIPICGFGHASYAKNIFFYPNISCFVKWLEVSGFKPELLKQTHQPLYDGKKRNKKVENKNRLKLKHLRCWYTDRIKRRRKKTLVFFKATCTGPSVLEYGERML